MVLLLILIYTAFISLGLPDSLLGSSWPAMYGDIGVTIGSAGAVSIVISFGTIVSSLLSAAVIKRFGTGAVTLVSVAMTAVALFGFAASNSLVALILFAVPLGLGGGSVDAALNNFVALHYKARHMSWLHCFWGVGASIGPIVVSICLSAFNSWNMGYIVVGAIQSVLCVTLFRSLPLWRRVPAANSAISSDSSRDRRELELSKESGVSDGHAKRGEVKPPTNWRMLKLPGAKFTLAAFFCYCGIETSVGLWGSSYLVMSRGVAGETAAAWVSTYFIGITVGRFLSGFLTMRFSNMRMVFMGQLTIALGVIVLLAPLGSAFLPAGLFIVGLGSAPIYPSLIHETPKRFGAANSQHMIGLQMACAYAGSTLTPPLIGLIGARIGYGFFPIALAALLCVMIVMAVGLRDSPRQ